MELKNGTQVQGTITAAAHLRRLGFGGISRGLSFLGRTCSDCKDYGRPDSEDFVACSAQLRCNVLQNVFCHVILG